MEKYFTISAEEAEWLELYRNLKPIKRIEYRAELRSYVGYVGYFKKEKNTVNQKAQKSKIAGFEIYKSDRAVTNNE